MRLVVRLSVVTTISVNFKINIGYKSKTLTLYNDKFSPLAVNNRLELCNRYLGV